MKQNFHEVYSRDDIDQRSSDRAFGIVFFVVCSAASIYQFLGEALVPGSVLAVLGGAFLAAALVRPRLLAPLAVIWFRFGLLLHRIVSPVVMGLLYVVGIVPIGLLLRLTGYDPLRRRFDPAASTYWITRTPPGPAPATMKDQF